jgi:hypothetical protein
MKIEMVISSHANDIMKEPLDMVDEYIDTFIQTDRRRWDFGRLIFYRDPIYDIEGSPREGGWSCYLHRTIFHAGMIHMFGNLMMT